MKIIDAVEVRRRLSRPSRKWNRLRRRTAASAATPAPRRRSGAQPPRYVADISLPGMVYGALRFSDRPRGACSASTPARPMPGVIRT